MMKILLGTCSATIITSLSICSFTSEISVILLNIHSVSWFYCLGKKQVCFLCEAPVDVKFEPCGHALMCHNCADRAKKCPTCKARTVCFCSVKATLTARAIKGDMRSLNIIAHTVYTQIVAVATINFSLIPVRLLIEGGSYSRAALTTFHIR